MKNTRAPILRVSAGITSEKIANAHRKAITGLSSAIGERNLAKTVYLTVICDLGVRIAVTISSRGLQIFSS